jgi:hypothetical protein
MNLQRVFEKTLIFDNVEDHFYDDQTIELPNSHLISFSPQNVVRLDSLEVPEKKQLLDAILNACPGVYRHTVTADLFSYRNNEGLGVYFKEDGGFLLVAALGEFQPARYKIFVEGVFAVEKQIG